MMNWFDDHYDEIISVIGIPTMIYWGYQIFSGMEPEDWVEGVLAVVFSWILIW